MSEAGDLRAFYEALIFVAERPLSIAELAELGEVPALEAEEEIAGLATDLASEGRGLRLQHHDGVWQLVTAPEVGERLAAYASRAESRLTPAALEALAIVAYRQPCTRAEVDRVRGVDSDYVLRSLLRRLVTEVGRRDTPGRPILYGTTFTFLERFGLTSLEELPAMPEMPAEVASPEPAHAALPEPADAS